MISRFQYPFETTTCGKWILAGEHSVLRGHPALVFPLLSRNFRLRFFPKDQGLDLKTSGDRGSEFELLFWGLLEKACSVAGISRSELRGEFFIDSNVPIGGGLGASAALCAAVAKFFREGGLVGEDGTLAFACQLENVFHGESSGVDVAVALEKKPVLFYRKQKPMTFEPRWNPSMALQYTGKRGITSECVNKVKKLFETDPVLAESIDQEMAKAVRLAIDALSLSREDGFALLERSVATAQTCFHRWGLTNAACEKSEGALKNRGAVAVKLTGSGDGGFLLGLWQDRAQMSGDDLLECF